MDFDFHALYAAYPTKKLLQIIAAPAQYQASAVRAAEDILAARNPVEVQHAENELRAAASPPQTVRSESTLRESIFDEVEPVEQTALLKRYRIIITIAIGIVVGYALYQQAMRLWYTRDLFLFFGNIHTAISIGIEGVSVVAIVLFNQKKHRGWILMAGMVTFYALSFLLAVLVYIYFRNFYRLFYTAVMLMLHAGVAYLLWMPGMRKFYHVDGQTASRTMIFSAIVTVGYCIWIAISMWADH